MTHSALYSQLLSVGLVLAAGAWTLARLARGAPIPWRVLIVSVAFACVLGVVLVFAQYAPYLFYFRNGESR